MKNIVLKSIVPDATPKSFTKKAPDAEMLRALFSAARVAPSADNMQIWRFVVIEDKLIRKALLESLLFDEDRDLLKAAPTLVACVGAPWVLKSAKREQPFFLIDVPIAISHLRLAAADLGLAFAYTPRIEEKPFIDALRGTPGKHRAVGLIGLSRKK